MPAAGHLTNTDKRRGPPTGGARGPRFPPASGYLGIVDTRAWPRHRCRRWRSSSGVRRKQARHGRRGNCRSRSHRRQWGSGSRHRRGCRGHRGRWPTAATAAISATAPRGAIPGGVAADAPPRPPAAAATVVAASVAVTAPAHMTARRGAVVRAPTMRVRFGSGNQCQHHDSARQNVLPRESMHVFRTPFHDKKQTPPPGTHQRPAQPLSKTKWFGRF